MYAEFTSIDENQILGHKQSEMPILVQYSAYTTFKWKSEASSAQILRRDFSMKWEKSCVQQWNLWNEKIIIFLKSGWYFNDLIF